jgi:hypothetical protein
MDYSKQERSNTMKFKALFVFFFGIVLSLIVTQNSFASWPITATPEIKGTVLDVTTGQPIENAIIEVTWLTSVTGIADRTSGQAGYILLSTGKDGKYRIPSKIMLQPLGGVISKFRSLEIIVRHPFYEHKDAGINASDVGKFSKEGKLKQWDVRLLSLRDKYPVGSDSYQVYKLSWELNLDYFILANKMNVLDKIKVNYLIIKLRELVGKYREIDRKTLEPNIESINKYCVERGIK